MWEFYLFRYSVAVLVISSIGFAVAGCGFTRNNTTVSGGANPTAITQRGSDLGTWNRTPQGGTDEKSNNTPPKPAD